MSIDAQLSYSSKYPLHEIRITNVSMKSASPTESRKTLRKCDFSDACCKKSKKATK